jgi:hypothetical protein
MNVRSLAGGFVLASALLFVLAPPAVGATNPTNTPARAVSISRQLVAYTPRPLLSSALCVFAERVKRDWLSQLGMTDTWRDPIVFVVREREAEQQDAPAVTLETFQTDLHFKYQVRLLVPPLLDESTVLDVTLEALCAELANRAQSISKLEPYQRAPIPAWLVQGLTQSLRGQTEPLLAVVRRSIAAGRPQQAADLFEVNGLPVDALDRQLFQANAWLFTEGLLGLPDGARKMQRYLAELGAQKSVTKAFWSVYRQDFQEKVALEKWWGVQLSDRTTTQIAQALTAEETSRRLEQLLRARLVQTGDSNSQEMETEQPLSKLWPYYEKRWLRGLIGEKRVELEALRAQAHPRYGAVINEYSEALTWLLGGRINRFRRAIVRADAARATADRDTRATTAYLDQAERIYATEDLARLFDGYFRTLEGFQSLEQLRRNPISDYLDKFDH